MKITTSYKVKIKHFNGIFRDTLKVYNDAVFFFIKVILKEWKYISSLSNMKAITYIESVTHKTKTYIPKYNFDKLFYKMPTYLRRAAIMEALGMVSSYKSNHNNWLKNKKGKEPQIPKSGHLYPSLYSGNMFKFVNNYEAKIKVYRNNTWNWLSVTLNKLDMDYLYKKGDISSPTLIKVGKQFFLRFSHTDKVTLTNKNDIICAVDLGLNNACTIAIMRKDGTILSRDFLKLPSETDQLTHFCNLIKKAQQHGANKTPRLWAKVNGINKHISNETSLFIINAAMKYNASVIVFEHLDIHGKKRFLKQRLHLWKYKEVLTVVESKAHRLGMRVSTINPNGTSKYAYDGSGPVIRNNKNHSICKFTNGKIYNCDLSAAYNTGARYYIRDILKSLDESSRLSIQTKVSECLNRNTCTLSTLISLNAVIAAE